MKKLVILSVILAGTISVVLFISLFPEKIITFITDNFTEYRISCEKIRLNTVNGGYITGLYFDVPDENITISADSVEFEVSMKRLLKDRQLAGSCLMKGVSFLKISPLQIDALEQNSDFEVSGVEARKAVEVILAIYESAKEQKLVKLN